MQSNTAAVGNQDVNCASFSLESRKSDPFTVVDGRYIGHDGFVVPKDFAEFYERYPRYVRNWVARRTDRSTPKPDIEDWTTPRNKRDFHWIYRDEHGDIHDPSPVVMHVPAG